MSQGGVVARKTSCKDGFPLLQPFPFNLVYLFIQPIPSLASCYLKGGGLGCCDCFQTFLRTFWQGEGARCCSRIGKEVGGRTRQRT